MPSFDISFLNKGTRKSNSQDYGFLVDQLDIKQSQLESDGKLSPGDYDLLRGEAQKIYSHPGLTPAQRSNIEVKLASYEKSKKVTTIKDTEDLGRLDREAQDDNTRATMLFANDPNKFLTAQAAVQKAKIDQLASSIDRLDTAGDDSSSYANSYNNALNDYNDTLQALDDIEQNDGTKPSSNYAAYVTTNARGEVVSMKVGRIGAQSGYLETNGIYGGLPLYGKVNKKENGKNIFTIGAQTFSGNDVMVPGPDGTFTSAKLTSSDKQKTTRGGFTIGSAGYTPVDLTQVRAQGTVRPGGYVQGSKGFIYQMKDDGTYKKYVSTDKKTLGINDNDIISVPSSYEKNITRNVTETIDGSIPIPAPIPSNPAPQVGGAPAPQQGNPGTTEIPMRPGLSRTPSPTQRAPQDASGVADQTKKGVGGFFSRLFGGK